MRDHRRHRAPVLDYRCGLCRRVFNTFTGTAPTRPSGGPVNWSRSCAGSPRVSPPPSWRELGCDRSELLEFRHRLQGLAQRSRDRMPLDDQVLEADGAYQDAGGKGVPYSDPDDPSRRRGKKSQGPRQLGQRSAAGLRGDRA
jgi:hypothetical protein